MWKAVCALKAFGCPKPCGCSVQPNLDWGDIYSFLFLILNSLRPKSSSVGMDDHTQSMENLWVPRGLFFSLKAELLPEFSPWRRGCPHVLLGQQGWSSRTFPHPGWRFFPAFFCHWRHFFCHGCLSDWVLHILGVFKCQPSTDGKSNLVLLEPLEVHQIKAPDSKVISFMMSSFLELRSSSEPDEHFGRRDNF